MAQMSMTAKALTFAGVTGATIFLFMMKAKASTPTPVTPPPVVKPPPPGPTPPGPTPPPPPVGPVSCKTGYFYDKVTGMCIEDLSVADEFDPAGCWDMVNYPVDDVFNALRGAQERLVMAGYNTNGIDGKCGPSTKKAINAYQAANGLTVTGKINKATRDKLFAFKPGVPGGDTWPIIDSNVVEWKTWTEGGTHFAKCIEPEAYLSAAYPHPPVMYGSDHGSLISQVDQWSKLYPLAGAA